MLSLDGPDLGLIALGLLKPDQCKVITLVSYNFSLKLVLHLA